MVKNPMETKDPSLKNIYSRPMTGYNTGRETNNFELQQYDLLSEQFT